MKIILWALLSVSAPGIACDWRVDVTKDAMTDAKVCQISSATAKISFFVDRGAVRVSTGSAYRLSGDGLQMRVDELPAVRIRREARSSDSYYDDLRQILRQVSSGSRLRTHFLDYPNSRNGDAEICTLPAKLQECGADMVKINDTRTQSEKIRGLQRGRR